MKILTVILGIMLLLNFMRLCGRQKKPMKAMAINSLSGVIALCIAAAASGFFGGALGVNPATVTAAAALGVPGVVMMTLVVYII